MQPPTVNELEAQVLGNKLSVPVTLIDGSSVRLPYEIGTTVASCIPLLGQLIGLDNYGTFALFESCQVKRPTFISALGLHRCWLNSCV